MGRKQIDKSSTFVKGVETFLASESILFAYPRIDRGSCGTQTVGESASLNQ